MTPQRQAVRWVWLPICCIVLAGCAVAPQSVSVEADPSALARLSWMVGHWEGTQNGARIEEFWTPPAGGTMLGVNRTINDGRTVFFEFLRIEESPDGIAYLASPLGRYPPTRFQLAGPLAEDDRRVTFENPAHDFPQRILYWRSEDNTLHGRIEGLRDGRPSSSEWVWRRAESPTR